MPIRAARFLHFGGYACALEGIHDTKRGPIEFSFERVQWSVFIGAVLNLCRVSIVVWFNYMGMENSSIFFKGQHQ